LGDDFGHKKPLVLKFKEKAGKANFNYKLTTAYKESSGFSATDETKFQTPIKDLNIELRLKSIGAG